MADVLVYPGFKSGLKVTGSCYQTPFQFSDLSYAKYGTINSWTWNFGDDYSSSNFGTIQNPSHLYSNTGNYILTLTAGSSKGCLDTTVASVIVLNKPSLSLPFRDTLICSIDTLALQATGNGIFSWSSNNSMIFSNTSSPLVFPKNTTKYVVSLDEKGCIATDSVIVNVLDNISIVLPSDTTICKMDSFQMTPVSEALQYKWYPNTGLSNSFIKNPIVSTVNDTRYQVTANLGKCQATTSINVKIVPYPQVIVGNDTTICYGSFAQLHGIVEASSFAWTPAATLQNANTLSPLANPGQTTAYMLKAYDTIGCPKPLTDTVVVNVLPHINAFAGNDTMIVAGQPLQLYATGGNVYVWSPNTGLSNNVIANPVATLDASIGSMTYIVRVGNGACFSNDSINVKVFKTGADIFVPSAFTPDGDGKNDVLKPVLVGIKNLENFKVYNRWGQLVYSTDRPGQGWDGTINGIPQQMATFVYIARGTSYLDKKITRKGTVILIR